MKSKRVIASFIAAGLGLTGIGIGAGTAIANSNPQFCVTRGTKGDVGAQGNNVLYNWNRSTCPSNTYGLNAIGQQGAQGIQGIPGPRGIQGPTGNSGVPSTIHYYFAIPSNPGLPVSATNPTITVQNTCELQADSGPGTQSPIPQYECQYED